MTDNHGHPERQDFDTEEQWQAVLYAEKKERERQQAQLQSGDWKGGGFWVRYVSNWLGSTTVMLISRPLKIPGTNWVVELHKFCASDAPGCYHTHPYTAWRVVFYGGYTEQLPTGELRMIRAGHIGKVTPEFAHRVHALYKKSSWSLWIHGPVTHEVKLVGSGW